MTRTSDKAILQQAYSKGPSVAADFELDQFEIATRDKGYNVIHSKALQCPCKIKGADHLTSCKNCGGSGWIFVNPTKTRMVVSGIKMQRTYEEQARRDQGVLQITALNGDKLSFMDKIELSDGLGIHTQNLYPTIDTVGGRYISFTIYDIYEVEWIGLFIDDSTLIQKLEADIDYTVQHNIVTLTTAHDALINPKISIRYKHHPVFFIWDVMRDSMTSLLVAEGAKRDVIQLPVLATTLRAHLMADVENFDGDRLLDNSWDAIGCNVPAPVGKTTAAIRALSVENIYNELTEYQRVEMTNLMCGIFTPAFAKSFT